MRPIKNRARIISPEGMLWERYLSMASKMAKNSAAPKRTAGPLTLSKRFDEGANGVISCLFVHMITVIPQDEEGEAFSALIHAF